MKKTTEKKETVKGEKGRREGEKKEKKTVEKEKETKRREKKIEKKVVKKEKEGKERKRKEEKVEEKKEKKKKEEEKGKGKEKEEEEKIGERKEVEKVGEEKEKKKEEEKGKKKKKAEEEKVEKIPVPEEVKKLREKKKKKRKMLFRGRFGKSSIRRKHKKKWRKWRYPRGIDMTFKRENIPIPMVGRGSKQELQGVHPSGYKEKLIHNIIGLQGIEKNVACRISRTVGKRKRVEILKKAKELKVKILNA